MVDVLSKNTYMLDAFHYLFTNLLSTSELLLGLIANIHMV